MSRSTIDLINEMEREAAEHDFDVLGIAVGFDDDTKFVFASDNDRLEKLNELVRNGGEPIGLLGFLPSESRGTAAFYSRPFEEYADQEWVRGYLNQLIERLRRALQQMGIPILPVPKPDEN